MKNRAIFLDRDGTLNRDVGYPSDFRQIHLYPFSFGAVRAIRRLGFLPVVVTNQSGIGRGLIPEPALRDIHRRLAALMKKNRAGLAGIYYCPHYVAPADPRYSRDCACRKPKPGMGRRAAADLNLDLRSSYMIGDKVEDILFGRAIGAVPVLVLTGYGRKSRAAFQARRAGPGPAHVTRDLGTAVRWIERRERAARRPGRRTR
jgi:D-glycero-D-manno-heptose 1,7-bisphosphate phosphatase